MVTTNRSACACRWIRVDGVRGRRNKKMEMEGNRPMVWRAERLWQGTAKRLQTEYRLLLRRYKSNRHEHMGELRAQAVCRGAGLGERKRSGPVLEWHHGFYRTDHHKPQESRLKGRGGIRNQDLLHMKRDALSPWWPARSPSTPHQTLGDDASLSQDPQHKHTQEAHSPSVRSQASLLQTSERLSTTTGCRQHFSPRRQDQTWATSSLPALSPAVKR